MAFFRYLALPAILFAVFVQYSEGCKKPAPVQQVQQNVEANYELEQRLAQEQRERDNAERLRRRAEQKKKEEQYKKELKEAKAKMKERKEKILNLVAAQRSYQIALMKKRKKSGAQKIYGVDAEVTGTQLVI
ncbi:hypothetical protein BOX15_Mlig007023g2 [Macrostomum lignano]|uniref:Uncharacterized protein n=1 Tax=Macrostomum lignano TaxID=282301 RepID=A0A267DIF8_9PLAT|nr:hypothetical protein BOX15_Mlig007023g2 [Macrostomum lignano]